MVFVKMRYSRLFKFKVLVLFSCLAGLYILIFTPDTYSHNSQNYDNFIVDDIIVNPIFDPPLEEDDSFVEACTAKDLHLYYVKIHKTGSSTFQNILYRLGVKRNSTFALFGCMYGMSYPHPPKPEYLFQTPSYNQFSGYHLITDHTQFSSDSYTSYMPDDTKVVTLLRHPLHQLKSTFGFWGLPVKFGIQAPDAVEEYINDPEKYEQKRPSFGCPPTIQISQTKNPQSHHLGLSVDDPTTEDIENLKSLIDQKFSLVLILEQFEESLLIFKRMFCLSFQDIIHLNLFSTKSFHRKTYSHNNSIEDALINKHRTWSKADYTLYDYFVENLNQKIEEYGNDLQHELQEFRSVKDKVREFCSESCEIFESLKTKPLEYVKQVLKTEILTFPQSKWNPEFSVSRGDCALMMFETLIYDEAIKAKQWPTACPGYKSDLNPDKPPSTGKVPNVNSKYCNTTDHFVPNFPWEVLKKTQYFSKNGCLGNL